MKEILNEFTDNNNLQWRITYSKFYTFFFYYFYINYKINEINELFERVQTIDTEDTNLDINLESNEDRLQQILDLKEKGLISENVFNIKKKEILKEI